MDFVFQRTYRGPLKAVLLDWAGTTMDYGCFAPAVVFMEVYKRKGVEISIEEARAPMGAHKKVHIRHDLEGRGRRAALGRAVHGRKPNECDVEEMFRDFIPLQLACLADYADLIPGTLETVAECAGRGLKIGSTTGYTEEMMQVLLAGEAKRRGYEPDATVCATQVPAGRPHPYHVPAKRHQLCRPIPWKPSSRSAILCRISKRDLNAGMWTIGLAKTGNELGLTEEQIAALDPDASQDQAGAGLPAHAPDRRALRGGRYLRM